MLGLYSVGDDNSLGSQWQSPDGALTVLGPQRSPGGRGRKWQHHPSRCKARPHITDLEHAEIMLVGNDFQGIKGLPLVVKFGQDPAKYDLCRC